MSPHSKRRSKKRGDELRVVANFRMDIQGKMRAVERDIIFKGELQLPAKRASHRLQARPEQTVVDDQKIDSFLCGLGQNARGNVDCRADSRNSAGIFNLQTIKRVVPIAHVANAQKLTRVIDDLG